MRNPHFDLVSYSITILIPSFSKGARGIFPKVLQCLLKSTALLFITLSLTQCASQIENDGTDRPPNILFIMVDDLGKEWVSCYGADSIITPNIDQLAQQGIRFENVYSMPQCTPTRVTLLTGQYPFRHGWVNHWDVPRWGGGAHFDETTNPSLGRLMKAAGYETAIAGKWQINDFRVQPDAMERHGFDHYCMWTGYETGVEASAERYWNPYIFTETDSRTYPDAFGPDIFKNFIIDFIHEHRDTSMFIYFPMVLTHTPLVNPPGSSAEDNLGKHKAMVRYTDAITGEVIQALEDAGVRNNTVVIWTTDNGTARGIEGTLNNYPLEGGKGLTTEAGINAPFIVSCPGKAPRGQVSDALIDFSDLLPTFLDIAGREVPSGQITDGVSFKEVIYGDTSDTDRSWILSMGGQNNARLTEKGVENEYRFRDRVLRNKRYKLYVDTQGQPAQFYDLETDPTEQQDLSDNLSSEEVRKNYEQLASVIETFPEQDSDPRYIPLPPQSWDVEITAESQVWKK